MIAGEESAVIPTLGSVSGLDPYPDNFPQAADAFYNKTLSEHIELLFPKIKP